MSRVPRIVRQRKKSKTLGEPAVISRTAYEALDLDARLELIQALIPWRPEMGPLRRRCGPPWAGAFMSGAWPAGRAIRSGPILALPGGANSLGVSRIPITAADCRIRGARRKKWLGAASQALPDSGEKGWPGL
jgi:hypothetical protein